MSLNLNDQIALVTGSGRGIGRSIALMLGRAGAHVITTARTETEIEAVSNEINIAGGSSSFVSADLANETEIKHLFSSIASEYGQLDVLVNNAGLGIYGPLKDFKTSDFDLVTSINLRGSFICCREAMQLMSSRSKGYIINISSVTGFKGYENQSVYTATKHGIIGLTKSLSLEAQPYSIRVSAILPGAVNTEMVRDARPDLDTTELLNPDDIADAVKYLLSLSEQAAVDQIYIRRRTSKPF